MPKRPAEGHTMWRDQFVAQMRTLQEARGWSDAGLADRVSKHYPMSPSAIWKLKNATPARGLSLDEALAITYAFGFTSMDQLLSTWTTAGRVQDRITTARERVIVYRQQLPLADVLAQIREASEALEVATTNGQRLKDAEVANLEAGTDRLQRETAELVGAVSEAARQIAAHLEHLEASIQANGGSTS